MSPGTIAPDVKLRIAVWFNVPSGGARRALYNHVQGLVERGHEVEIWSPPLEPAKFADFAELAPEHQVPLELPDLNEGSYVRRLKKFAQMVDGRIAAYEAHSLQCAREIQAGKFDLLFANTDLWFHSPYVGRFLEIPKVLYLQEPNRPLFEMSPRMPWLAPPRGSILGWGPGMLKRRFRDFFDCRNARTFAREEIDNAGFYDRILVNSFFSRESVLRAYGRDARVCYLGVDTAMFQNHGRDREGLVVGIGSFIPAKNQLLVIEAIGTIPTEKRPKLIWIGNLKEDEYFARLERRARELGVNYEAKLLISDEELVSILNRASLMAYAPRLEPFGFAPIEAGGCGLPVVAVAEGGVRETVKDGINGLLVEAILRLLEDEPLRQKLAAENERQAREIWTLEASNDDLERHLREIFEAKR
jgi:glycosyltransferase involved in cell wall biosynthesis